VAEDALEDREQPGGGGRGGDRGGGVFRLDRGGDRDRSPHPQSVPGARGALSLRRAAVAALALIAGGCAYLTHEKQGELIFRPTREAWWGFDARNYAFVDQWIPVGQNGERIHGWWLPGPNPNAPTVLYLHGARWNLTGSVTRIERWQKLGFAVLAVDYRGFGESSDVAPTEKLAYEDAEAAWDQLARLAPGRKRYIVGHSLGGAIATELAVRRPEAAGLVLEATFTSVRDMISESQWGFLPVGLILNQEFDALDKIGQLKMPVLVVHGTRDTIVPFHMGERLFEAAHAPKRFVRVEGAGHHNLSGAGFGQYQRAIAELFK
jgi:alpha-beta hydrolase superfamily lysophospholipase